ncbi:hypothetical protein B7494_g4734 [Chlorociboria aeruginascens]|nr:hypothetical protein B7494_g4734 [Chlorociboria aeruginascens]
MRVNDRIHPIGMLPEGAFLDGMNVSGVGGLTRRPPGSPSTKSTCYHSTNMANQGESTRFEVEQKYGDVLDLVSGQKHRQPLPAKTNGVDSRALRMRSAIDALPQLQSDANTVMYRISSKACDPILYHTIVSRFYGNYESLDLWPLCHYRPIEVGLHDAAAVAAAAASRQPSNFGTNNHPQHTRHRMD